MSRRGIDLSKDIVSARIDGMLCRAEKKGWQAGKLEIARNMLEYDIPIEKVVEICGLSKEDILNSK
jgi:predicted transposase YdaD